MAASDLEEILERVSDGFVALDRGWRYTYVNRAAVRYLGRPREELLGRIIWEEYPGVRGTELERDLLHAAATLEPRELELRSPILKRMVKLRIYPSARGITLYFLDVTAEHDAVEALRESEAKYRALFEQTLDGFALTEPDGTILEINRAGCEMLQRTAAEVRALGRGGVVDTQDPRLPELLARRAREGHVRGELNMLRADGTRLPVDISSAVFRDGAGRLRTSLTFRDLTEQKRALTTLSLIADASAAVQSSLALDDVLGAIARVVVPAIADLVVLDVVDLPRIVRVVGRGRADEAPAIAVLRGSPPVRETARGVSRVLRTGEPELVPVVDEAWLRAAAQSEAHFEAARAIAPESLLMVPLTARGKTIGVLSLTSLSPQRRYRDEDLPLASGIADRAALAIDNARLYEDAVAARVRRDEMVGIVSHDLRSPLNGIALNAEVLARREGSAQVAAIQDLVAQGERLVRDLMAITAIESGKLPLDRQPESIAELVEHTVALHRATAEHLEIALSAQPPAAPITAPIDRHRLVQALGNLLGNALKFTPRGGKVELRARRTEAHVLIEVADTGRGIAPEGLAHIFDRFWRGHDARSEGIGLGLAIAKGVAEAHGGAIEVESQLGQGTTFSLRLPVAPETP